MASRHRAEHGQSTVEFAISALVLVLLLFGLVDLGRVFYYDVGLQGAAREGARSASWFNQNTGTNPGLDDTDILAAVNAILSKDGLPPAVLQNPGTTCPAPTDGNTIYNPPYADSTYPTSLNAPSLYICYANTPGLDLTSAPTDNSMKGDDVNVILVMSFGFVSDFMSGVLGNSVHIVANAHMTIGGY